MRIILSLIAFFLTNYLVAQTLSIAQIDSMIEKEKIFFHMDSAFAYENRIGSQSLEIKNAYFMQSIFDFYAGRNFNTIEGDAIINDLSDFNKKIHLFFQRKCNKNINCIVMYTCPSGCWDQDGKVTSEIRIREIIYKYYYRDIPAEYLCRNDLIPYSDTSNKISNINLIYKRHKEVIPKKYKFDKLITSEVTDPKNIVFNSNFEVPEIYAKHFKYYSFSTSKNKNFPEFIRTDEENIKYKKNKICYYQAVMLSNDISFINPYYKQLNDVSTLLHPSFLAFYVRYQLPPNRE